MNQLNLPVWQTLNAQSRGILAHVGAGRRSQRRIYSVSRPLKIKSIVLVILNSQNKEPVIYVSARK